MSREKKEIITGLDMKDIFEIGEMAKEKRRYFDIGMQPIGDNIFKLIRKENIYLIYSAIQVDEKRENNFSAIYVSLKEGSEELDFIGLNTADYFDKQIFALAHELYHHFNKTQLHFCRLSDEDHNITELKANRFAAEFLLPTDRLENEIREVNNGDKKLTDWKASAILRLIARLHCEYRLPYKAIVRRLQEIESIDKEQYELMLKEPVRDIDCNYYSIGCGVNKEMFEMLNKKTYKTGVDGNDLEKVIRNYEDDLISISELVEALNIFEKKIEDFGLGEEVDMEDIEELSEYFERAEEYEA